MRGDALLRRAREEAGWAQADLAKAARVPASVVSAIESGQRDPSTQTLDRLLAPLGYQLGLVPLGASDPGGSSAEFVEALRLAEALPHGPSGSLSYPRLRD